MNNNTSFPAFIYNLVILDHYSLTHKAYSVANWLSMYPNEDRKRSIILMVSV